jgi:hypothetical protein
MPLPTRVVPVELRSSLSLDQAQDRLRALHRRGDGAFASRRDVLVKLSRRGRAVGVFVTRDAGRNLIAELRGELSVERGGCRLVGEAAVHPLTWYLPAAVTALVVPVNVVVLLGMATEGAAAPVGLLGLAVPTSVLLIAVLGWLSLRNRAHVVAQVSAALGSPDSPDAPSAV